MSISCFVNITELIDRCPLGPLQIRIIVLCGLVALLDGFDLLANRRSRPGDSEFSHLVLSAPKMGANHRALRRACQLFSRASRVLEVRSRTALRRLFRYLPRAFEKLEQ